MCGKREVMRKYMIENRKDRAIKQVETEAYGKREYSFLSCLFVMN